MIATLSIPTLEDLPGPPAGRTGWPWTEAPPAISIRPRRADAWPRISIVTPSFNQGKFIEETIRSVLLQGYPNLEYIVMDGGSTDETVEIIRRYERWIDFWISEPDDGQSAAINAGLDRAGGAIGGWLNSDDLYRPGALASLAQLSLDQPNTIAWSGVTEDVDIDRAHLRFVRPRPGTARQFANWWIDAFIHQPGCLFDLETFRRIGGVNERLRVVMDGDLWLRMARVGTFACMDDVVAVARIYPDAISQNNDSGIAADVIAMAINAGIPDVATERLDTYAESIVRQRRREIFETMLGHLSRTELLGIVLRRAWAALVRRVPFIGRP
ncbi:MAG: glycosyl transferase [Phycisphaeraceae bacterium]|nr:glycosyl transferase [Phycisphaeraceae bacterium]